jgi:hypothetical protein
MSNQSFTRKVVKGIVKNTKISPKGSKGQDRTVGEAARSLLTTSFVQQCLVLNTKVLNDLAYVYSVSSTGKGKVDASKYKRELKAFVKGNSATPNLETSAGSQFNSLVQSAKLTWGKTVFYLPTTFKGVREIIEEFNRAFSEKTNRDFDQTKFGKGIQLDHGGEGFPSGLMGAGVGTESVRQRARKHKGPEGEAAFNKEFGKNIDAILRGGLNSVADKGRIRKKLMTLQMDSHQLVNGRRGLIAGMSMLITPALTEDNSAQASGERSDQDIYIAAYQKTLSPDDVVNMDGSSTILEKVEQLMADSTFGTLGKRKNARVTRKPRVANKSKSKGKADEPRGKGVKVAKLGGANYVRKPRERRTDKKNGGISPFSYMAMINKRLPQTVRENMGAPALENISGKFASSVRIRDVNTTPQGYPSFGYTYAKNPYQVFEVGTGSAPWATPDRDPRKLIDKSIREVAAELAIGRFYTRRL